MHEGSVTSYIHDVALIKRLHARVQFGFVWLETQYFMLLRDLLKYVPR